MKRETEGSKKNLCQDPDLNPQPLFPEPSAPSTATRWPRIHHPDPNITMLVNILTEGAVLYRG